MLDLGGKLAVVKERRTASCIAHCTTASYRRKILEKRVFLAEARPASVIPQIDNACSPLNYVLSISTTRQWP